MTPRPPRAAPPPSGFTLLEGVIAMTVLLIGLVGALSTITFGANSDRAARAQTLATVAAQELLSALNALPPSDTHLSVNTASATAPGSFGPLLSSTGSINTSGSHMWSDGDPIAGVRTDTQLAAGPEQGLELQRRWTVWDYTPPGMPGGSIVRLISVSVIYRDPTLREVVVYGQRPDLGALLVRVFTTG
jgi:type II secretory pathway pseudopilin PulG